MRGRLLRMLWIRRLPSSSCFNHRRENEIRIELLICHWRLAYPLSFEGESFSNLGRLLDGGLRRDEHALRGKLIIAESALANRKRQDSTTPRAFFGSFGFGGASSCLFLAYFLLLFTRSPIFEVSLKIAAVFRVMLQKSIHISIIFEVVQQRTWISSIFLIASLARLPLFLELENSFVQLNECSS